MLTTLKCRLSMSDEAPRPSATVILLRQGPESIETFLVQRHGRTAFGNAWAFPGGVVETFDARVHGACTGKSAATLNRLLDVPNALNYYSAAIRELFEETGVLLGSSDRTAGELDAVREALNAGRLAWDEFVADARVSLDIDALHYVSYWVTPLGNPRRFATRFFLARMPAGQTAQHCGGELVDCQWTTPGAALDANRDGALPMIFPTIRTLRFLDDFASCDEAIAAADKLAADGIVEILPKAVESNGKRVIVLPGDPRYTESPP